MAGTLVIDTLKSSTANPPTVQNTSGTEIGTFCRAWVNFNGVTTAAIRASFNVSSVVRNSTGDYTVNFTNSLPDANYSVPVSAGGSSANYYAVTLDQLTARTASAVRIGIYYSGTGYFDSAQVNIAVFR